MNKKICLILLIYFTWFSSAHAEDYLKATKKTLNVPLETTNSDYSDYYDVNQNTSNEYLHCKVNQDCFTRTEKHLPNENIQIKTESNLNPFYVHFDFNVYSLGSNAIEELNSTKEFLSKFNSIQLRGWADPVGGKKSKRNQFLARKRAEAVAAFINNMGIDKPIRIFSEPPCCNLEGNEKSPESIRKEMRVVEVLGVN